jgi:dolichyl-phosphate-mannose--protein O-mannosyl transferase
MVKNNLTQSLGLRALRSEPSYINVWLIIVMGLLILPLGVVLFSFKTKSAALATTSSTLDRV